MHLKVSHPFSPALDKFYDRRHFKFNSQEFPFKKEPSENDSSYSESCYFKVNSSVLVKVVSIDSTSTQFFKSLTMFSSNGVGKNIFVGENAPLPSNVTKPGFGIWYGYSAKTYQITIK